MKIIEEILVMIAELQKEIEGLEATFPIPRTNKRGCDIGIAKAKLETLLWVVGNEQDIKPMVKNRIDVPPGEHRYKREDGTQCCIYIKRDIYTEVRKIQDALIFSCFDLFIPEYSKFYKKREGEWRLDFVKTELEPDAIRFVFYDNKPTDPFRVRVLAERDLDRYFEYQIVMHPDGRLEPVTYE